MADEKKALYSAMQATGVLHIGNYYGALKNWINLCDEYDCYYAVADLHALTVRQDPQALRKSARNVLMMFIAAGLDPEKNCIYYQSSVPAHSELSWILNCFTYMGELQRMTQFKEKSSKHADNINAGLFTYPVLMASDILLYQASVVPVGDDQKQHLEITRDIAERFNSIYGEVFTVPEAYFGHSGARIMSLADPSKKMSKSDENPNGCVYVLDDKDTIIRKFKRAVTDSDTHIIYSDDKPGIRNLIDIYMAATGSSVQDVEKEFDGKGYGEFKLAVGEAVADAMAPVRNRFDELSYDKAYVDSIIRNNAERAAYVANKTLRKVRRKVGLPDR